MRAGVNRFRFWTHAITHNSKPSGDTAISIRSTVCVVHISLCVELCIYHNCKRKNVIWLFNVQLNAYNIDNVFNYCVDGVYVKTTQNNTSVFWVCITNRWVEVFLTISINQSIQKHLTTPWKSLSTLCRRIRVRVC